MDVLCVMSDLLNSTWKVGDQVAPVVCMEDRPGEAAFDEAPEVLLPVYHHLWRTNLHESSELNQSHIIEHYGSIENLKKK